MVSNWQQPNNGRLGPVPGDRRLCGCQRDCVSVRGTRRQLGVAQPQKTALQVDALRSVILNIPADLRGLRDRALLLVGCSRSPI
jgi:hypothetical protein